MQVGVNLSQRATKTFSLKLIGKIRTAGIDLAARSIISVACRHKNKKSLIGQKFSAQKIQTTDFGSSVGFVQDPTDLKRSKQTCNGLIKLSG